MPIRIIMQVHGELVFEVRCNVVDRDTARTHQGVNGGVLHAGRTSADGC
ncbi:MAG: hypothetical protein HNEKOMLI_00852 [Sodalis sp. Psp]|nr:hypothetical protein [Sodalis sp. Psp]MCR3757175.1 hypothetical protein [Sodalis sp. Ppy]